MYLNCQNASYCSDPLFVNGSRTAPEIDKIFLRKKYDFQADFEGY